MGSRPLGSSLPPWAYQRKPCKLFSRGVDDKRMRFGDPAALDPLHTNILRSGHSWMGTTGMTACPYLCLPSRFPRATQLTDLDDLTHDVTSDHPHPHHGAHATHTSVPRFLRAHSLTLSRQRLVTPLERQKTVLPLLPRIGPPPARAKARAERGIEASLGQAFENKVITKNPEEGGAGFSEIPRARNRSTSSADSGAIYQVVCECIPRQNRTAGPRGAAASVRIPRNPDHPYGCTHTR